MSAMAGRGAVRVTTLRVGAQGSTERRARRGRRAQPASQFPVIARVAGDGDRVAVTMRLHSVPARQYSVELFRSARPDASGYGAGERFLGSVLINTNDAGNAQGVITIPRTSLPAGTWLSGTATGQYGTSEFSAAVSSRSARPVFRPPARTGPQAVVGSTTMLVDERSRRGVSPARGVLA
jgi:hypothetical protein